MTIKDFTPIQNKLLRQFNGFFIQKRMMILPPTAHTLRAFYFEPSGFDKHAFFVESFFMPLCVPQDVIHFNFGKRIKNARWSANDPNMEKDLVIAMQAEVPFLQSLHTPRGVIDAILQKDQSNAHCREAVAYMLARIGDTEASATALESFIPSLNRGVRWQSAMADRAALLLQKIRQSPQAAMDQLLAWEQESKRNLGLSSSISLEIPARSGAFE